MSFGFMDLLRSVWDVLMSYEAMQDSICYADHESLLNTFATLCTFTKKSHTALDKMTTQ